jgi:3-oxoacyl-ACP reductase-like protein
MCIVPHSKGFKRCEEGERQQPSATRAAEANAPEAATRAPVAAAAPVAAGSAATVHNHDVYDSERHLRCARKTVCAAVVGKWSEREMRPLERRSSV